MELFLKMKNNLPILFALIFMTGSITFSAEGPSQSNPDSSANQRRGKNFMLVGQPVGLGPLSVNNTGVTGALFLNSDSLLGVSIQSSSGVFLLDSLYTLHVHTFGAFYKKFLRNSLYVKGGADYRRVNYQYNSTYPNGTVEESTQFVGTSTSGNVALGNQWQWDNFALGCDWVGFTFPVSHTIESQSTSGTYSNNVRRLSDDTERYLSSSTFYFTQLYLGWSF